MGRFINCFTVVILKFKMATILDLIWSITLSLQRIAIVQLPGSQSGNREKHSFFLLFWVPMRPQMKSDFSCRAGHFGELL